MGASLDLDHLESLAKALAEYQSGPWWWDYACGQLHLRNRGWPARCLFGHGGSSHPNDDIPARLADHIAALDPQTVLQLIAEIREHREADGLEGAGPGGGFCEETTPGPTQAQA